MDQKTWQFLGEAVWKWFLTDIPWKLLPLLAALLLLAQAARQWKRGERAASRIGLAIAAAILGVLAGSLSYHGYVRSRQEAGDAVELQARSQQQIVDADRVVAQDARDAVLRR